MSIIDRLSSGESSSDDSDDTTHVDGEFSSRPMTNRYQSGDTNLQSSSDSDQPSQLEMVHQELDLLVNSFETKQVGCRERDSIIDGYADLMQMVAELVGEYKKIKWIPPSETPTMDEMGNIVDQVREYLVPEHIQHQSQSEVLYRIYNQSQKIQRKIGEKEEFEYAYAETGIGQTYGHEIQSFGIPNGLEPERLPEGEDGEEVYARGRALKAMENLSQDPNSPLWLGVGTRNGRDASIEKDVLFRHRAIFGQTGYGKSTLLTNDAKQLIESGAGMCFIDPKGDDSQRLMQLIPDDRLDDVLWIEPGAEGEYLSGFNYITLGMDPDDDGYEVARSNLVADLKKMLKMSADYWGPRMDRVAANLITAMNMYNDKTPDDAPEMNLVDLYYILKSEASRKEFAARCKKAGLKFVDDYTEEIAEMNDDDLEPLLGRFLPWIQNPIARRMIGFREGGINIPKAIDDNKIIIVRMGSEPRELKQMLGMAVIRRIWSRIRSRANQSIYAREPFYLFVDEFDNIALADETIPSIISESRSYRLSLNIANQYPKQLPSNVVDAITTNCDTIISFNPGDLQSARQYSTQLGVDPEKLTDEVNYHVWLRTTLSGNMEKSDAFRCYVYPPHPPKRKEDVALDSIQDSLKRFGRRQRSDEETYRNLLYNGGGGKWETGIGAEIQVVDDDDIIRDLEIQLEQRVPGPDSPSVRDEAVIDEGDVDEAETSPTVGPMADPESVIDQKQEVIFEAIFAAAVQEGKEPGAFVPTDDVVDELKLRIDDEVSVELSEVANAFEKLSSKYVERERISGEPHIRLSKSGQAKVFDQDTGSAGTGGGEEHRWILRKSFGIFTRLGYITDRPLQDGDELPDAVGEAPFDFTDVDPTLAPNKKVDRIQEQREKLKEEYPEVWNLSKGNDVSIEAETTTIDTPVRMITNLRKAVEQGNTCVFATKEGEDNFTEWAEKGEKNIYETRKMPNSPSSEIVSDEITFMKAAPSDGIPRYYNQKTSYQLDEDKVALRPTSNKRGSVWYQDPDSGDIVCAPTESTEIDDDVDKIRFDSIDQIDEGDPTAVPAYYEYDRSESQYVVNAGGTEYVYPSKSELKDDWEEFNAPLIPEIMFPEMPTEGDWVFIIYPDADNEEYDQPQIYERGECKPLFDTLGADIESVDVKPLNEGVEDAKQDTSREAASSSDEGTMNAPGEYTTAAQQPDGETNPQQPEGDETEDSADPDTADEKGDEQPSQHPPAQEQETISENPEHEISTSDQQSFTPEEVVTSGDEDGSDTGDQQAGTTALPKITPREIADHPSCDNLGSSKVGRIGAGSSPPSEEEFNAIYRRIQTISPEAAEYIEEPGHLTDIIHTAGSQTNGTKLNGESESASTSESGSDSSDNATHDQREDVPPQQGAGDVEVDPELGETVENIDTQVDQKADKLNETTSEADVDNGVSESGTDGSDDDATQSTQQSQQTEHESTQQPHTPSDEQATQQTQTDTDATENPTGVCTDCRYKSEFKEDPIMGVLFCGNCGYTPKREIRERLRPDGESVVEMDTGGSADTGAATTGNTGASEQTRSSNQPSQSQSEQQSDLGGEQQPEGETKPQHTTEQDVSDEDDPAPHQPDISMDESSDSTQSESEGEEDDSDVKNKNPNDSFEAL